MAAHLFTTQHSPSLCARFCPRARDALGPHAAGLIPVQADPSVREHTRDSSLAASPDSLTVTLFASHACSLVHCPPLHQQVV